MITFELNNNISLKLLDNDILEIGFFGISKVDIKIASDLVQKVADLPANVNLLVDIRCIEEITDQARSLISQINQTCDREKTVILVGTMTSRIIGNHFLKSNQFQIPLRLYSSREDAINWLRE